MATKLSYDVLFDYATARLAPDAMARVGQALESDVAAARQLENIRRVLALSQADHSQDAPSHVVARASRLLRQRKAVAASSAAPGLLRRVLAALSFDSVRAGALGMRSGDDAPGRRQLLFAAEGMDIDVHIAPAGADFSVQGQVMGPVLPERVWLEGAAGRHDGTVTALGEFDLRRVPAGTYTLVLSGSSLEVATQPFGVGSH